MLTQIQLSLSSHCRLKVGGGEERRGDLVTTRKKKLSTINGPNPVKPNPLDYISSRLNGRFGLEFFYWRISIYSYIFMLIPGAFLQFCTDISTFSCNSQSGKKNCECCECLNCRDLLQELIFMITITFSVE